MSYLNAYTDFLMSGMHAAHEKINMFTAPEINTPTDFTGGTRGFFTDASNRENDDIFARPEWNHNGISPEPGVPHTQYMTPMVKQLRDSGYYTIHIGKGHWASMGTPGVSPYNMGFIVNVAGNMAGMPRSYYAEDNFGNQPDKWTSDNGGHSLNTAKNSVPHTFNAPLREGKGSVYEGGVRVPMMVYWPGKTEAGMRINTPVTFLSAIRKGDWKLVYRMHDGRLELYNLKKDLSEKNDVSAMHPKIVRELAAELSDTLREWEAPMPLVKATGKLVPMPDELF